MPDKTSDPKDLAVLPRHDTQLATPEPSVGQMLQSMCDRGVTDANVAAFERLIALKERMEDRAAEKEFASAFARLQAAIPAVEATRAVPGRDGGIRFKFAPYEDIMYAVRPLLVEHGFSVSFNTDFKDGRIHQTCTLMHSGGHSRSNTFMVRIGSGPPGSSEAQADGSAATYAKRFALCAALNITIEHDTDARNEGQPISFEQAQTLKDLVKETKSDEKVFLSYAGATKYEEIGSARYNELFGALQKKLTKK